MADWTIWINLGVPMVILAAVAWTLYKIGTFLGHRLFDDEGGLVCNWVSSEQRWRTTLTERLESQNGMFAEQQFLCAEHAKLLGTISESIKESAVATHVGNGHLERLVELHQTGAIGSAAKQICTNTDDLQSLKKAAIHACDLCEAIAKQELPGSAAAVTMHCARIRDIIGTT
jgi:hypothetical protein